jgi:hemoglobin-like flavoprotein
MDDRTIGTFDSSLRRCDANPRFLDLFYERFQASSPNVRAKFASTNFDRQKRVLRASFYLMLLAAESPRGPEQYLKDLAARHSAKDLNIGTDMYDLWLDSLLATVRECDPKCSAEVEAAWEAVMGVGIEYMVLHYHHP